MENRLILRQLLTNQLAIMRVLSEQPGMYDSTRQTLANAAGDTRALVTDIEKPPPVQRTPMPPQRKRLPPWLHGYAQLHVGGEHVATVSCQYRIHGESIQIRHSLRFASKQIDKVGPGVFVRIVTNGPVERYVCDIKPRLDGRRAAVKGYSK